MEHMAELQEEKTRPGPVSSLTPCECGWVFRRINSKIIFTIRTVSLSFVLEGSFSLSMRAAYSLACSHGSQGHKSPLLELSP